MTDRSGGDVVVDVLARSGVDVVFGIPSVHNLPIYDALRRDGRIRAVTVRHEQGAVGAADRYARTTGRLGVCLTSTGPGAANTMGGQLEAYVSSSAVLHLTGQIDSRFLGKGRGFIHEVPDQLAMMATLSKASHRPASVDDVGATVTRAVDEAMTCRRGPVSVEIPIDFQYTSTVSAPDQPRSEVLAIPDLRPDASDVARAAELIARSRRPIVWAGGGAVASRRGRRGESARESPGRRAAHEPERAWGRTRGRPHLHRQLALRPRRESPLQRGRPARGDRDALSRAEHRLLENGPARRLVQLDVDPNVPGRNYPVEAAVVGDAKLSTAALLEELDRINAPKVLAEPGWAGRVVTPPGPAEIGSAPCWGRRSVSWTRWPAASSPAPSLSRTRPSPLTCGATGCCPCAVPAPRSCRTASRSASGCRTRSAPPSARRIRSRAPGRGRRLSPFGDRARQTVAQEELAIVVLVFVDGGYGILRNIQESQFGSEQAHIGVDLGRPDFCGLAQAFGIRAERVESVADYRDSRQASARGPQALPG